MKGIQRRIQRNLIKQIKPYRYTILKALIDLYPQFRFDDKSAHRADRVFSMFIPKDLSLQLGFKASYFYDVLNELRVEKLLTDKWIVKDKGVNGVAVALNFYKYNEYADGIPGRMTWRRLLKKLIGELSKCLHRGKTTKRKSETPQSLH